VAYPTIFQYQEALQSRPLPFLDQVLKDGQITKSGLGTPVVASGGFALTYAVQTLKGKFAVRCFHRDTAVGLDQRYAAILQKLKGLASPYFVEFEYQQRGVNIGQTVHPIVKMRWANGETLGQFAENHYDDRAQLSNLLTSLGRLATHLQDHGIAHGDIQEGNLMVANDGRQIQLIDYDGMYVPSIAALGSTEQGHRDFQHPGRQRQFNDRLDRFSFIVLNLALRALCEKPDLWDASQSGAGVILFRGSDFADPGNSQILAQIRAIPKLQCEADSFAAICAGGFDDVPTLADFLAGRGVKTAAAAGVAARRPAGYVGTFDVLEATDLAAFRAHVGRVVELVGRVLDVVPNETKVNKKPYHFIDFGDWRQGSPQIIVWGSARGPGRKPSEDWAGTWVSIRGLLEPVMRKGVATTRVQITATTLSQIVHLTPAQAQYRLGKPPPVQAVTHQTPPRPAPVPVSSPRPVRASAQTGVASSSAVGLPASPPTMPAPTLPGPQSPAAQSVQRRNEEAMERMRRQAAAAQAEAARVEAARLAAAKAAADLAAAQQAAARRSPPPVHSPRPTAPPPFAASKPPSLARQWPGTAPLPKRGVLGWLRSLFGF